MALVKAIVDKDSTRAEALLRDPHYDVNEIGYICEYECNINLNVWVSAETYKTSLWGTPLMAAVSYYLYRDMPEDSAYITLIKLLLNHDRCDVNVFVNNDTTVDVPFFPLSALHCAIASNNKLAIQLLLNNPRIILNSCIDAPIACYYGDIDLTLMLMERKDFDINPKEKGVRLPLHAAAAGNHVEIAKVLLKHPDCVMNIKDSWGDTARRVAMKCKSASVVQLFIEHSTTPLIKAILEKNITCAEALLRDPDYDVNEIGEICDYKHTDIYSNDHTTTLLGTPLMAAVSYYIYRDKQEDSTYNALIELMLNDERCDVNAFTDNHTRNTTYLPCTALHFAIASGNEIAKQLLLNHPRITLNSNNDASIACYYGDINMMRTLMERENFNIKVDGRKTIYACVQLNRVDVAQMLLNHDKCDLSAPSNDELSILDKALGNKYKTAEMLFEHQKFICSEQMDDGLRLCHAAVLGHRVNIISKLMKTRMCDTCALTHGGESAVTLHLNNNGGKHWLNSFFDRYYSDILDALEVSKKSITAAKHTLAAAIEQLPVDICERWLQLGADVDSSYCDNETALHCAIRLNSLRKVQLLLRFNANLDIKWMELNPLQYAIVLGSNPKILQVLSKNVQRKTVRSYITQLSYPTESPLLHAQRLGVEKWTQYFVKQSTSNIRNDSKNTCCYSPSFKLLLNIPAKTIAPSLFHHHAFKCHRPEHHRHEAKAITEGVMKVAIAIASHICKLKQYSRYHFTPCLGGSMAEGSKTYVPNEVDLTCLFNNHNLEMDSDSNTIYVPKDSDWRNECIDNNKLDPFKVSDTFVNLCRIAVKSMDKKAFYPLFLTAYSFDTRDKISHLCLLWRGDAFKELTVHADLAPSFQFEESILIAKASRHKQRYFRHQQIQRNVEFHVSDAEEQRRKLRLLPREARQGLLIAKAARIADICRPDDMRSLDICDDIDAQNIITSYQLVNVERQRY